MPVLFVQQEAGQLFRDIAIAISFGRLVSACWSSITVIPSLSAEDPRAPIASDGGSHDRGFRSGCGEGWIVAERFQQRWVSEYGLLASRLPAEAGW